MKEKTAERQEARRLRQEEGMSVKEIAKKLGVAQSSVSIWVRDVEVPAAAQAALRQRHPQGDKHPMRRAAQQRTPEERAAAAQAQATARERRVREEWEHRWTDPVFQRQLELYLRRGRRDTAVLSAYVDSLADVKLLVALYRSIRPQTAMFINVEVLVPAVLLSTTEITELLRPWVQELSPRAQVQHRYYRPSFGEQDEPDLLFATAVVEGRSHGRRTKDMLQLFLDWAQEALGLSVSPYKDELRQRQARVPVTQYVFTSTPHGWNPALCLTGVPQGLPPQCIETVLRLIQPPETAEASHLLICPATKMVNFGLSWPAADSAAVRPCWDWRTLCFEHGIPPFLPMSVITANLERLGQACGGNFYWSESRKSDADWFGIPYAYREQVVRSHEVVLTWLSASRLVLLLLRPHVDPRAICRMADSLA